MFETKEEKIARESIDSESDSDSDSDSFDEEKQENSKELSSVSYEHYFDIFTEGERKDLLDTHKIL